ncbi:hypothetical protein ACU635_25655 [[Actinomadura] parvosata]|uniref:hypothetical protein n=1 Tax=[Actinomadura] parvosata TaxID=1955412 RepID=UPI00406CBA79
MKRCNADEVDDETIVARARARARPRPRPPRLVVERQQHHDPGLHRLLAASGARGG